jgi:hypothetical protein
MPGDRARHETATEHPLGADRPTLAAHMGERRPPTTDRARTAAASSSAGHTWSPTVSVDRPAATRPMDPDRCARIQDLSEPGRRTGTGDDLLNLALDRGRYPGPAQPEDARLGECPDMRGGHVPDGTGLGRRLQHPLGQLLHHAELTALR